MEQLDFYEEEGWRHDERQQAIDRDFITKAELLRNSLQYSVEDNFMTQEQADKWFAKWVAENKPYQDSDPED